MSDVSKIIDVQVKDNVPHVEYKDPVQQIKKKVVPTSLEAQRRAEEARKEAHTLSANAKRNVSMEIKNKLSESFDFIEESCGSGSPEFEFYDEPKMVAEGLEDGAPVYPIIGRASGVFAPIGVMSRNNRIYDNDHYDYLLENQQLVDRIAHRGMLGTIGHHDKKVDDQDLAEGKVSHIVTNLRIVEEADGSRNLYGTLEILDTPAGHLLKTYYDSGVPLFVSSRGGGNLLPVPNESYKRVDKTKYFLETFDIVKNPGFLQAKPVYEKVSESEEIDEKVIVATKDHMENVHADKLAKERAKDGKAGDLVDCGGKVDLDGSMAAQKKRLEDKCNEEVGAVVEAQPTAEEIIESIKSEPDKLDKLTEALTNFVNTMTEINEDKKQKKEDKEEENKPEDEKNEDGEDAVATSEAEEEKKPELSKMAQKLVNKILDPHAGMTKKDIENGNVQTKLISPEQAHSFGVGYDKAKAERKAMAKELREKAKANPKPVAPQPKEEPKQLPLFCSKEELAKYLREAMDKDMDNPQGPKKPMTLAQRGANASANFLTHVNQKSINNYKEGKMNDNNSKIEKALQAIEEADKMLEQPIVAVKAEGDSTKSAQEAEPKVKEPVTCDRLELARALKAQVKNNQKVEV